MMKKAVGILLVTTLLLTMVGCAKTPTWQEQYDLGLRYFSEGNYEEAIIAFAAAIEIEPEHAEAYIGLADTYIGLGDLPQARDSLTGGLEAAEDKETIKEKLSDVQYEIGMEYLEDEEYEEAINAFQDALENNPKNESAYLGLSEAFMGEGKIDEALDALRKAMEEVDNPSGALTDKLSELERLKDDLDTLSNYYSDDALEGDDLGDLVDVLSEHEGMCYDGEKLVKDFTGVGMTMLFENCVYYGDLVNGEPNGTGKSTYRGDPVAYYTGQWSGGKPNGAGILTVILNGTGIAEGNWIDGKGNGQFVYTAVGYDKWTVIVEAGRLVLDGRWQVGEEGEMLLEGSNGVGLMYVNDPRFIVPGF